MYEIRKHLTKLNFYYSSPQLDGENSGLVVGEDLEHLCQLVEVKDAGPAWMQMMDRSTPTMYYQAWRRDPEVAIAHSKSFFYK